MKWLLKICFIFLYLAIYSQTNNTFDSLVLKLNGAKTETRRQKVLAQIYDLSHSKSAQKNSLNVLLKISKFNNENITPQKKGYLADLYLILADAENKQSHYLKAIDYLEQSLKISELIKDKYRIAYASGFLAHNNYLIANTPLALYFAHKGLRVSEELKDSNTIARLLSVIATVYLTQEFYIKSEEFYIKTFKISKAMNNLEGMASAMINISIIKGKQKKHEDAIIAGKKSLIIYQKMHNIFGEINSLNNLGWCYFRIGNIIEAKKYFNLGIHITDSIGYTEGKERCLLGLGNLYFAEKNFNKAIQIGKTGLYYANKIKNIYDVRALSKFLKEVNYKDGNYKEAMKMYELEILMRDSIYKESNRKAIFQTALQYEYEKKHLADSLNLRVEKKIVELNLSKEKTKNYILYCIVAFVIVVAFLLYNRYRLTQEKKELIIQAQKLVVDTQEKELTKTELDYLRAQINPHFLFNALNTIYFMIHKKDIVARTSLNTFAAILRYQLYECDKSFVTIEQEVTYLKDYIQVQLLRKGAGCSCDFNVSPNATGFVIAPLLLVPFVENAFNHLSNNPTNKIEIFIDKCDTDFIFLVKNSKNNSHLANLSERKGIGIQNVKRRLVLIYKNKHNLKIIETENEFEVNLSIIL